MGLTSIQLPDDVQALARARAAATGHANIDEYVLALIRADAAADKQAAADEPPGVAPETDEELEEMLLKRANSPSFEVTPEFWRDLRQRVSGQGGEPGAR